jgi:hypothetical protein
MTYGYNLGSVGTAPDGFNYPVYKEVSSNKFLSRSFDIFNTDLLWSLYLSSGNPWDTTGTTNVGQVGYNNTITQGSIRWPQGGVWNNTLSSGYTSYPSTCPTPTPTITPTSSPAPSGTTEAQTYLSAVVNAGGTGITSTVSAATITLFTSLVSNGLWDKMVAFYPMLGGNSAGAKFNARNPLDTDAAYRLVFNGGWTFNASGATSNGTNAYANTYLSPSAMTIDSQHLGIYLSTNNAPVGAGKNYVGAAQSTRYQVIAQDGTPNWYWGVNSGGSSLAGPNTQGMLLAASSGTTNNALYRNGTSLQITNTGTRTAINVPMFLAAMNNNGTPIQYYANQFSYATFGLGLTAAQVSTLTTIINTFQTTLGRNTF